MANERLDQIFQPIRDYADIVEIDQAQQAIEAYIAERERLRAVQELEDALKSSGGGEWRRRIITRLAALNAEKLKSNEGSNE